MNSKSVVARAFHSLIFVAPLATFMGQAFADDGHKAECDREKQKLTRSHQELMKTQQKSAGQYDQSKWRARVAAVKVNQVLIQKVLDQGMGKKLIAHLNDASGLRVENDPAVNESANKQLENELNQQLNASDKNAFAKPKEVWIDGENYFSSSRLAHADGDRVRFDVYLTLDMDHPHPMDSARQEKVEITYQLGNDGKLTAVTSDPEMSRYQQATAPTLEAYLQTHASPRCLTQPAAASIYNMGELDLTACDVEKIKWSQAYEADPAAVGRTSAQVYTQTVLKARQAAVKVNQAFIQKVLDQGMGAKLIGHLTDAQGLRVENDPVVLKDSQKQLEKEFEKVLVPNASNSYLKPKEVWIDQENYFSSSLVPHLESDRLKVSLYLNPDMDHPHPIGPDTSEVVELNYEIGKDGKLVSSLSDPAMKKYVRDAQKEALTHGTVKQDKDKYVEAHLSKACQHAGKSARTPSHSVSLGKDKILKDAVNDSPSGRSQPSTASGISEQK